MEMILYMATNIISNGDNRDETNNGLSIQNGNGELGNFDKDYDMQMLKNLIGQTVMVAREIGQNTNNQISEMKRYNQDQFDSINQRLFQIENNEEVTTEQEEDIKESAKRRVFVIIGSDEMKNQTVTLKDLDSGEQKTVAVDKLVEELQS